MRFLRNREVVGSIIAVVIFVSALGLFSFLNKPHGEVKGLARYSCTLCNGPDGCQTYDYLVSSKEQCAVEQYKIDSSYKSRR